jgi:hypothetical protein
MIADRRTRRAHSPLLAAEYLLDTQRRLGGARAVALFDGREMLAGSAESRADEVTLRTWAVEVARGGEGPSRDLFVHRVPLWGRELLLASLDGRVSSVKSVTSGLLRILAG